MPLRPIKEQKTKAQQVYEALREAICTGELPPGTPLVLQQVAERMAVSEIPVREAVQQLKHQGLVETIPYTGTVVAPLVLDRVRQTLEVRAVLEGFSCRHAVPRLTDQDLNELERLIGAMDDCIARRELKQYSLLNRTFHLLIHSRCHNVRVRELLEGLLFETDRARAIFVIRPESAISSNQEHKLLMQFLRRRDADAAEALMRAHQLRVVLEFEVAAGGPPAD